MSDQPDSTAAAQVMLYASVGPPTERVYAIGPFDTEKAAKEWLAAASIPLYPTRMLPVVAPADLWLCAHCGDLGPVGTDHTCPCPWPDSDCPHHGWKATTDE